MHRFIVAVGLLWLLMLGIAVPYAMLQRVPPGVAIPVVAAFLLELALFLLMAFPTALRKIETSMTPVSLAGILAASGLASYLVYAVPVGKFEWRSSLVLLSLCALAAFWFLLVPRAGWTDLLFVAMVAAVVLTKVFKTLYPVPWEKVETSALGQLVWIRLGILSVLWFRRMEGIGFGFWPRAAEWTTGARHFLYFLPFAVGLGYALGYVHFRPLEAAWWKVAGAALGTFAGMMWVVALGEEFFFRGLLQQWLAGWLKSSQWGLVAASLIFGCAHLPFRGFPNWRFAILAAAAGWFYGRAYQKAQSIRAAMVAHALTNVIYRIFFTG